ncbi:hypothetical protein KY284_020474 [Solanum tuberosum]|nr:hypothetical protein KY284_020474 [Solanum tuberosum]
MMRRVYHIDYDYLYIVVNRVQLQFEIAEFALVTELLLKLAVLAFVNTFLFSTIKTKILRISSPGADQSEHLSNQFFYILLAKPDVGNEKSPISADLKEDIDGLKTHVDEKFKEILEAFSSLKNKISIQVTKSPVLEVHDDIQSLKADICIDDETSKKFKGELSVEQDSDVGSLYLSMRVSAIDAIEEEHYRKKTNALSAKDQDYVDSLFVSRSKNGLDGTRLIPPRQVSLKLNPYNKMQKFY